MVPPIEGFARFYTQYRYYYLVAPRGALLSRNLGVAVSKSSNANLLSKGINMALFAGIDVGGEKRGFSVTAWDSEKREWSVFERMPSVEHVVARLKLLPPTIIAIDCPPRATISGKETRAAERELHRMRYKVQWTRRDHTGLAPQEWMLNGERLWNELAKEFGREELIETFPTVGCSDLADCDLQIPLRFFQGKENRIYYKDLIDAALCAHVAMKHASGKSQCVGETDELGPIHW